MKNAYVHTQVTRLVKELNDDIFKCIFEDASIGIAVLDIDLHFLKVNNKVCDILGYSKAELLAMSCPEITHPEDVSESKSIFDKVSQGLSRQSAVRKRYLCKSGDYKWTKLNLTMAAIDGSEELLIGVIEDINELVTAEIELKSSEENYRSFFKQAMDMIYTVDMEGYLTDVNEEMLKTMEYSRNELLGHKVDEFLHPGSFATWREIFEKLKSGQSEKKYGLILKSRSGRKISTEVSSAPVLKDKEMSGAWSILRNVTEVNRAAIEMNRINKQIIEKNRELEQIVYVTSHDLRSPLVNIQGFTQEVEMCIAELKRILAVLDVPEKFRDELKIITEQEIPEAIEYINSGISKMDKLLKGLLTISRLGRRPLEIKEIDMNTFIRSVLKTFEFQLKDNEIELNISNLPNCKGDETQLSQVFSNIIDNAIKYRHEDRIGKFSISGIKNGEQTSYSFSDNGIGIAPEKREKVFEIFYRDDQKLSGEGLGLTLVRKIVEKHLGEVSIDTNPEKGTTIIVKLPN